MKTLVRSERYSRKPGKKKAPWPRLHGVDLPNHVRGTLPSTWLEYNVDDGIDLPYFDFEKVLQNWAREHNRRLFQGEPSSSRRSMGCQT